jgi:hypothetical protein
LHGKYIKKRGVLPDILLSFSSPAKNITKSLAYFPLQREISQDCLHILLCEKKCHKIIGLLSFTNENITRLLAYFLL